METQAIGDTLADAVREFMEKHGISYAAQFVPFSRSRNAKPGVNPRDRSINWRVTFMRGGRAFSTDYTQGIGYLPEHLQPQFGGGYSLLMAEEIVRTCEEGKAPTPIGGYQNWNNVFRVALKAPTARDVLESLALDSDVDDFRSYDEWASECGYDEDSRKGERVYNECQLLAREMRAVFGSDAMRELRAMEWN